MISLLTLPLIISLVAVVLLYCPYAILLNEKDPRYYNVHHAATLEGLMNFNNFNNFSKLFYKDHVYLTSWKVQFYYRQPMHGKKFKYLSINGTKYVQN